MLPTNSLDPEVRNEPVTVWLPLNTFEPVVAKVPFNTAWDAVKLLIEALNAYNDWVAL